MAEAVTHSTSRMTDEDLSAIATYLKDSDTRASAFRAGLPPAIARCALVRRFTRISQRRDSRRPAHLSCVLRSALWRALTEKASPKKALAALREIVDAFESDGPPKLSAAADMLASRSQE
jgi:hypothetical protein